MCEETKRKRKNNCLMKSFLLSLIAIISACTLNAQSSLVADSLSFLIGNWEGTGKITKKGKEYQFNISETVEWAATNNAIVVNGVGMSPDSTEVVVEGVGLVYRAGDGSGFHIHSVNGEGRDVISDLVSPEMGVLHWEFETEGGKIQYEMNVSGNTWREVGYFKPNDTTKRYPFLEMTMTKE